MEELRSRDSHDRKKNTQSGERSNERETKRKMNIWGGMERK